jgi:hypothetical protein
MIKQSIPAPIHATILTVRRTNDLVLFAFMAASDIMGSFFHHGRTADIFRSAVTITAGSDFRSK